MTLNRMSTEKLAENLTARSGKKYTRDSINGKLKRKTLTYEEMKLILDILGYKIEINQK